MRVVRVVRVRVRVRALTLTLTLTSEGGPLVAGASGFAALRVVGGGGSLLDASHGYEAAPPPQTLAAEAALRFVNSEVDFAPPPLNALLRALHDEPPELRAAWWLRVRGRRRRSRRDWRTTALAPLFTLASEFHDLQRKALVARVRALIEAKGLYSADAFNVFDADRTGTISCSELAGALAWLGLQLPPAEIHELVRAIDTDRDGMVGLDEWCAWMGDDEARAAADPARASAVAQLARQLDLGGIEIAEVRIPELHHAPQPQAARPDLAPLPPEQLARLTARLVRPAGWQEVWSSKGTGGARASVWTPALSGGLASANRARLCLGHHATTGLDAPRGPLVLELHDTSKNGMQTSGALPRAQAQLLPHPLSYRQVWSSTVGGAQPLFVWRPQPPSAAFVALGHLATSTPQPPPLDAVHGLG